MQFIAAPLHSDIQTGQDAEGRAEETPELLGAASLALRDTTDLGMSERLIVELTRAVAHRPRLLLMDEPTVLRNPDHAREFYELMRSLPKKVGCSLLIASEKVEPLRPHRATAGERRLHGTS